MSSSLCGATRGGVVAILARMVVRLVGSPVDEEGEGKGAHDLLGPQPVVVVGVVDEGGPLSVRDTALFFPHCGSFFQGLEGR